MHNMKETSCQLSTYGNDPCGCEGAKLCGRVNLRCFLDSEYGVLSWRVL